VGGASAWSGGATGFRQNDTLTLQSSTLHSHNEGEDGEDDGDGTHDDFGFERVFSQVEGLYGCETMKFAKGVHSA
jgi:hypothetical protein